MPAFNTPLPPAPRSVLDEPNNRERCVVADYMELYSTNGTSGKQYGTPNTDTAWGWNDQACNLTFPYVCMSLPGG